MIAAVGYSTLPIYLLIGQKKLKLARKINSQILYTDAKGQKADWLTSVATIVGVIGISFGLWWADAVAAIIIAVDIISDGVKSLRTSVAEIMEHTLLDVEMKEDPLISRVEKLVQEEDWIEDSVVRLKRAGNKIKGEILLIPKDKDDFTEKSAQLRHKVEQLDWQISDIVVSPVKEVPKLYKQTIF